MSADDAGQTEVSKFASDRPIVESWVRQGLVSLQTANNANVLNMQL